MTVEEIKSANRLEDRMRSDGAKLVGSNGKLLSNECALLKHKEIHLCVTVDVEKQVFHCNDCGQGGDVIRWIALRTRQSDAQVIKELGGNGSVPARSIAPSKPSEELKFETVATYSYEDQTGELVFQVLRQHAPLKSGGYAKTFKQRRPDSNGGWVYNLDGVERVLYRLPDILKAKTVWITEGEKDCDRLVKLGFSSTCNAGGAGKWMEAYSESLAKRHVVICGDNDEPGQKHVKTVFDAVVNRSKSVRIVRVPKKYKDVSEYADSFKTEEEAKAAIFGLFDSANPFVKGTRLPVFRLAELEDQSRRHVAGLAHSSFDLSRWLPSLRKIRSLVPGELVLILGATGIGKTAALSNIALHAHPIPTLFFELELPAELMFERMIALKTKLSCLAVEQSYRSGDELGAAAIDQKLSHLHICTESRIDPSEIQRLIVRSELKIGERPKLVLLDYVGLIQGHGKSRYERISAVAEELKIVAKSSQCVIVMASQVARDESPEISLSSGKDSGSLENSSGLVIGLWRDASDKTLMHLGILKSTKGGAGLRIECNYNLDTLAITERSSIQDQDVPAQKEVKNYAKSNTPNLPYAD